VRIADPSASGFAAPVSRISPSTRAPATIANRPTGKFTRNTQRHDSSTSSPPITGPAAAAVPPTAAQSPSAIPRFSAGNSGSSRPSEAGINSAAPAAWTTRAPTRNSTEGDAAQAAEARVKTVSPPRNARLRPTRSAQRPAGTSSAAKTMA
jgi:hypothetical protein